MPTPTLDDLALDNADKVKAYAEAVQAEDRALAALAAAETAYRKAQAEAQAATAAVSVAARASFTAFSSYAKARAAR
jgi:hypothetical protein